MLLKNLKLKFFFIVFILIVFYLIFKILNLFYLYKAEEAIIKSLKKKHMILKKSQKLLQENYWSIKQSNFCLK